MGKDKNIIDRFLMAFVNILLAIIIGGGGYGIKEIIKNQQVANTKQELTTQAINNLRVVLAVHGERLDSREQKDILQDLETLKLKEETKLVKYEIKEVKKRIHILEDITR